MKISFVQSALAVGVALTLSLASCAPAETAKAAETPAVVDNSKIPLNTAAQVAAGITEKGNGSPTFAVDTAIFNSAIGCTGSAKVSGTTAVNTYGTDTNMAVRLGQAAAVDMTKSTGFSVWVYVPVGSPIIKAQVLLFNASWANVNKTVTTTDATDPLVPGTWYKLVVPAATLADAANSAITSAVKNIDVVFITGDNAGGANGSGPAGVAATGYIDAVNW